MKKLLLVIVAMSFGISLLLAQATPQPPRAETPRPGIYVEKEEIVINVTSMIPSSGFYKAKADTYQPTGKYRFVMDDKLMREKSEILLNKWLKESK